MRNFCLAVYLWRHLKKFFYKVKEKIRYRRDSRGPSWSKVEMGAEKHGEQGRRGWKGTLKWKQPKCPSTDEQLKMCFVSITWNIISHKHEVSLPAITWRSLENTTLSESSQSYTRPHVPGFHSCDMSRTGNLQGQEVQWWPLRAKETGGQQLTGKRTSL